MRWTSSFPAISQKQIKPNPIFLLSILRSCIFSQVSCLRLLCFLWLGVSLIGDVELGSSRPCVQVWANYRDSHQGWATFWLHAQGIQSSWGSTRVKPVPLTSLCNQHTWEIQQAYCSLDVSKAQTLLQHVKYNVFIILSIRCECANSGRCWIKPEK